MKTWARPIPKKFKFTIELSGEGHTLEEAWKDAIEAFSNDPGSCPELPIPGTALPGSMAHALREIQDLASGGSWDPETTFEEIDGLVAGVLNDAGEQMFHG